MGPASFPYGEVLVQCIFILDKYDRLYTRKNHTCPAADGTYYTRTRHSAPPLFLSRCPAGPAQSGGPLPHGERRKGKDVPGTVAKAAPPAEKPALSRPAQGETRAPPAG
ncbi:hypothetical protein BACCAP_00669 [Pseudoflavonifractor capillosus ATCC 29799]|uniref:Uncharacterized protein n=1 Tax=Pseudoflavonifractor capillosus ATCC 29799 TaxID=411467 RepID=A6NR44_9FIRM|nr:hypothetical protein BACCAP_00669 [Pseudoflavonifractor capillosus ATCC 29799]